MITTLRRFAAAAIAAFAVAGPASATSYSTDYTDLWWNPAEDGWGVNVIQQYNTLFATLFVYGADGSARWYVASELTGSQNSYSGTLYQTTGPAFSTTWNPALKTVTPVGSMTFNFSSSNSGTLTYTVNGAQVTKAVQRQSFRVNSLAGNFLGGMTAVSSGCSNPANNGLALMNGNLTIAQSGNSVSMIIDWYLSGTSTLARCTFNGSLTPQGRLATLAGNFSCTGGANNAGNFTFSEIDASANGINGVYRASDQYCSSYNGRFGGLRDVQ